MIVLLNQYLIKGVRAPTVMQWNSKAAWEQEPPIFYELIVVAMTAEDAWFMHCRNAEKGRAEQRWLKPDGSVWRVEKVVEFHPRSIEALKPLIAKEIEA